GSREEGAGAGEPPLCPAGQGRRAAAEETKQGQALLPHQCPGDQPVGGAGPNQEGIPLRVSIDPRRDRLPEADRRHQGPNRQGAAAEGHQADSEEDGATERLMSALLHGTIHSFAHKYKCGSHVLPSGAISD
ncbi:hypothetical protein AAFF_G00024700, partial [Aldrovandia affinis]